MGALVFEFGLSMSGGDKGVATDETRMEHGSENVVGSTATVERRYGVRRDGVMLVTEDGENERTLS